MKILIAMSGGVDSSVAAKLLCDAGNECIGYTMKLFDNCDAGLSRSRTCCSLDDIEDARSVAFSLGMRYYVFNFKDDFREQFQGLFPREGNKKVCLRIYCGANTESVHRLQSVYEI